MHSGVMEELGSELQGMVVRIRDGDIEGQKERWREGGKKREIELPKAWCYVFDDITTRRHK